MNTRRRSIKQKLAHSVILLGTLNNSRPRTDDGRPMSNTCKCLTQRKRTRSVPELLIENSDHNANPDNSCGRARPVTMAAGSHEDIHQLHNVSVKEILDNFRNLEIQSANSISSVNNVIHAKSVHAETKPKRVIIDSFKDITDIADLPLRHISSLRKKFEIDEVSLASEGQSNSLRDWNHNVLISVHDPLDKIDFSDSADKTKITEDHAASTQTSHLAYDELETDINLTHSTNEGENDDPLDHISIPVDDLKSDSEADPEETIDQFDTDEIYGDGLLSGDLVVRLSDDGEWVSDASENSVESDEELNVSGNGEPLKKVTSDAVARKLYNIVTEILTTERSYVKKLYLLDELFQKKLLKEAQDHNTIPEKVIQDIFSNLSSIYQFHSTFLLPALEKRIGEWEKHNKIGDVFKTLGHCLVLYTEFVKHFDHGTELLQHWLKRSSAFASVVDNIQKNPECENLALQHHLLGPIQRIPRYKLLLQDYLNKLPEDSSDREETEASLKIISNAADNANNSMKENEKFKKLLEIEDRIHDGLNGETLVTASRVFIKEGELKKQAARSDSRMARTLLLFNDLLLCCSLTPIGKLNVRQVMDIAGITIDGENSMLEENAFRVKSKQRVLDLIAHNSEEKKEWVTAIRNAARQLAIKRGCTIKRVLEKEKKNKLRETVGSEAPVWIRDEDVTMCMLCALKFGMFQRKHHCRGCGRVVCDKCSSYRAKLAYCNEYCRVCFACSQNLGFEPTGKSSAVKRIPRNSIRKRNSDVMMDISGYLFLKCPGKEWKKEWIVLSEFVLYVQKKRQDVRAAFTVPVPGYAVEECSVEELPDLSHPLCIKLHKENKKELTYYISTKDKQLLTRWLVHLKSASCLEKVEEQSVNGS